MPLDGITAKLLSLELDNELAGSRIEKINQPDPYDIYIKVRNSSHNVTLVASANPSTARFHLTDENMDNPMVPLRFCTILRKYLSGGRILSIDTPGYERIFRIQVQTMNEIGDKDIKTLIVEIMGRYSNLILLNENGRIIDAALHVDEKISRVREVLPTRMYLPPPLQNKSTPGEVLEMIGLHQFFSLPSSDFASPVLEQFLLDRILGVSPLFVQEICSQSGLDPKTHLQTLTADQTARLESILSRYLKALQSADYHPTLYYQNADAFSPFDFHAFSFQMFPFKKEFPSLSAAMDEFYARRARNNFLSQKKGYLVKLVNQKQALIARKIIIHNKDMEECRSMEQNKKYGDLILANLYRMRPGQKELTATDYYQENAPELLIPLQTTLSGSQNAQKYYKRYNKLKSKFESVSKLLDEERRQLDYFSSVQVSLSNVSSIVDIDAVKEELHDWDTRFSTAENTKYTKNAKDKSKKSAAGTKKKGSSKKPAAIPPRQYRSSDGFEILIGRNNLQNDILTMKTAHKDDIWMHIQKAPGTHVIIRTNRETLPDATLEEAAALAAWFSKNSEASINTKAVIDYCAVRNVWKPKNAAPGHVLYRDFKSITVKTIFPQSVKELNSSSS